MPSGLNLLINIIRIEVDQDDSSGGPLLTGTAAYTNVCAAIASKRPTQQSLEQGLETIAIYDLTIPLNNITIYERDEIQVTSPAISPYYNLKFRIIGVQPSKRLGQWGHQHATLQRVVTNRRLQ